MTGRHSGWDPEVSPQGEDLRSFPASHTRFTMGIDIHLIANFAALALITLAGPAVIFILFYRRGAL